LCLLRAQRRLGGSIRYPMSLRDTLHWESRRLWCPVNEYVHPEKQPTPIKVSPRAPFGPSENCQLAPSRCDSDTLRDGIPSRGTSNVLQASFPERRLHFSSKVNCFTNSTSRAIVIFCSRWGHRSFPTRLYKRKGGGFVVARGLMRSAVADSRVACGCRFGRQLVDGDDRLRGLRLQPPAT
jgi:hypothetical protein